MPGPTPKPALPPKLSGLARVSIAPLVLTRLIPPLPKVTVPTPTGPLVMVPPPVVGTLLPMILTVPALVGRLKLPKVFAPLRVIDPPLAPPLTALVSVPVPLMMPEKVVDKEEPLVKLLVMLAPAVPMSMLPERVKLLLPPT